MPFGNQMALLCYAIWLGSGCGSVGRAVASDSRSSRFEYSHKNILNNYIQLLWKDENKKEAENGPFLKKTMPFGRADIADTRWPNLVPNQLPEF